MPVRHVLAIDQGTTSTKVLLFDEEGAAVARAVRPVAISFPQPGWVEQDALTVWRSVAEGIDACLEASGDRVVTAVALSNQRESALLWDRASGRPLGPVVVWQCRRTAPLCDELRRAGAQPVIQRRTGLTIDPLFSASKIRWLLDAIPDGHRRAADGGICAGTIDAWLIWQLTGGAVHACDVTNASRTQLLNLETAEWDDTLLDLFHVPRAVLPTLMPSAGQFGTTVRHGRLASGIPIASAIGDSHAALFGHAAFRPGRVKATYGTGSSLMTLVETPMPSARGLSTTVAWGIGDRIAYALEGNITVTGSAVDWLGQVLNRSEANAIAEMAESVDGTGGVYLVPAFAGLGAPYWDAEARGVICGLTRGTTAAHLARATIESIAYQVRDVFDVMRHEAGAPDALLADGGASRNDQLMQFQADLLDRPVLRNESADLSASGAAWLAGLATQIWTSTEALSALPQRVTRFDPAMPAGERAQRLDGWREAVARARGRAEVTAGSG